MTTLLKTPIDAITFQHVRDFCARGIKEHLGLEYKREFSPNNPGKKIAKEVAAFANTHGGVILWGVDEEGERTPEPTPEGMPLGGNPRATVLSACDDHIFPPLAIEVSEYLRNANDDTRGFLVVRVAASEDVHTIEDGSGIYRRIADLSKPQRATLEYIEHLVARRNAVMAVQAKRRRKALDQLTSALDAKESRGCLGVSVGPRLSVEPLMCVDEMARNHNDLSVCSQFKMRGVPLNQPLRGVLDGLYYAEDGDAGLMDVYGNVAILARLAEMTRVSRAAPAYWDEVEKLKEHPVEAVDVHVAVERVIATIDAARNLLERRGFFGSLEAVIRATGVRGMPLVRRGHPGAYLLSICKTDAVIELTESFTVGDLSDPERLDGVLVRCIQRLLGAWGCGPDIQIEPIVDNAAALFHGTGSCQKCGDAVPAGTPFCRGCRGR